MGAEASNAMAAMVAGLRCLIFRAAGQLVPVEIAVPSIKALEFSWTLKC